MRRSLSRGVSIIFAGCLAFDPLWAQVCKPSSFNLKRIEFLEVARAVSDMTGQPISLDKSILKVKVNFLLDTPSSCRVVTAHFAQLIRDHGWTMRQTPRKIQIMMARNEGSTQQIRRMYSVRSGSAMQAVDKARSLLSPTAILQVPDTNRALLIADEADHILFDSLLEEIDGALNLNLSTWLELPHEQQGGR